MPRVGPPAATCSSIVWGFEDFRGRCRRRLAQSDRRDGGAWPLVSPCRLRRRVVALGCRGLPARPSVSSASTVGASSLPTAASAAAAALLRSRRRALTFGGVRRVPIGGACLVLAGLGLGGGEGLRLLLARLLLARARLLPRRGFGVGRLLPLRLGSIRGRAGGAGSATRPRPPGFDGAGVRRCPAHASRPRPRPRVASTRSSTSSQVSVPGGELSAQASSPVAQRPHAQVRAQFLVPVWAWPQVAQARPRAHARAAQRAGVAASPRAPWARPSASPGPCPRWRLASASLRSGAKAGRRVPPVWCLDPSVGSLLSRCARGGCTRGTDRDQRPPMGGTAGSCCMKARAAGEPARRATCCLHSVRSFGLVLAIGRGALVGCLRRSRATSTIGRYSRTGGGSGPAVTSAPRIPAGVAPTVEPDHAHSAPCGPSGRYRYPLDEPVIGRVTLRTMIADASPVSATQPLGAPERIRVLVVDDNDGFRESLVFLLSGEDLEVIGQAPLGRRGDRARPAARPRRRADGHPHARDGRDRGHTPSEGRATQHRRDRAQQHGGAALDPRHARRGRHRLRA